MQVDPFALLTAIVVGAGHEVTGDAPTADQIKAVMPKYAWKYHRPCKGRGYGGQPAAPCICAWKRMTRALREEQKALNEGPDPR